MNYRAYGLVLSSDLPLPELEPVAPGEAALSITWRSDLLPEDEWAWLQPPPAVRRGGWRAVGTRGREHRLLFDGAADFVVAGEEGAIHVHSAPADAVRHRLIDQVVPLVMSHRGRLILHGSAFVTPHGAVAMLGAPGAGKSTLAASFGLAGAPVIADDALFLEPDGDAVMAIPAYSGVRVCRDVLPALRNRSKARRSKGTRKQCLTPQDGVAFAQAPVAIRRVYVLPPDTDAGVDHVEIRRLSPRDAIMALVGHAFTLDIADRSRLTEQFLRVCAASAALDVRSLAYPRDLSTLSLTRDAILADLSQP